MKVLRNCILMLLLLTAISCDKKKKAFKVFNEGVSFSLAAIHEQEDGNAEKASKLNKQAIEKFRETLKIDSNYKGARSALGHSFFLAREFEKAIYWFEQANKKDAPMAVNFQELGLSKINLGEIKEGQEEIEKAFKLDRSKEIRDLTTDDLLDIGTLAFGYGKDYINNGEKEKGISYQQFAVNVLIMAYGIDNNRHDISGKIVEYADELKDKVIADKYRTQ